MRIAILLVIILTLGGLLGCSSSGNRMTSPDLDQQNITSNENEVIAAFDLLYDEVSNKTEVVPNREIADHFKVNGFIVPQHIHVVVRSWDPTTKIMVVDVTIDNPSNWDVYDVRGILTNMGDKRLINVDNYTKLFDTHTPKVANPFKAFAKDRPLRMIADRFAPPEENSATETYEIYAPTYRNVSFIITACRPDNAPEPYYLSPIQKSGTLYQTSGSLDLTTEALDWQDGTASSVMIEENPITGTAVPMALIDATNWKASIINSLNAAPGYYHLWVAAWDASYPYALYQTVTVQVHPDMTGWSDPVLVAGTVADEIIPKLVLRQNDYFVIYTDGTAALSKRSADLGFTWDASPLVIGNYAAIDTMHAVRGLDNNIYVQYQRSDTKYTYVSKYTGMWSAPVDMSYHGMTLAPYSCDLGLGADGYIYDLTFDDWSTFGFRSTNPYDPFTWVEARLEAFYNGINSQFDGFVQNVATPKFFYTHEGTQLDYAWWDGAMWQKAPARTGTDTLLEPAIAPESDGPWHGVMNVYDGTNYDLEYFRYDSWPPTSASSIMLSTKDTAQAKYSISTDGDLVSIVYDLQNVVSYVESTDGGDTFSSPVVIATGTNSAVFNGGPHVRRDSINKAVVVAYAIYENGNYNIYVRMKY